MSRTYCHTHSKYDCPTCADEILSLGIQADKDRIAALERELERLRKDAERYRWLRDDAFEHSDDCFMEAGRLFAEKHGVAFDEAIDAAIAKERKE